MRSGASMVLVSLFSSGACQRDAVDEESDGDETSAVDERWLLCDAAPMPEPPQGAGACAGGVPHGELDDVQAEMIFGRATHEISHLGDIVRGRTHDGGLFERDGDDIWALTDSGYVVGRVANEGGTARACVRVTFACWTGGHGGWGPSALDGRAEVLVDGDVVESVGTLGLSGGAALDGAPSAEVWVRIEDTVVEGSVGAFEL